MLGRPSDYNDEIAEEICDAIVSGVALHVIGRTKGYPSEGTIYSWLTKHPEFQEKYARAREIQQDIEIDRIVEIADRDPDPQRARNRIDARKWRAAKLAPRKYGDKIDMNLTATIESTPQDQIDARVFELLGKAGVGAAAGRNDTPEIEGEVVRLPTIHKTG